jgi:hypothetical protein
MKWLGTKISAALIAASLLLSIPLNAQVPPGPVNLANSPLGNLITLTAQAAGTVNGAQQNNLYDRGATCTFTMTSHTGTPSTTFGIQFYDRGANAYQTAVVSGAVVADNTPTTVMMYPGVATSGPTGYVGFSGRLTRLWRPTVIVAGTSPVVTGVVSCELLP